MNICPITINEIAIMTNQTVKSDFLHQTIEEEAWKEVSEHFPWTEPLLEKFQDEVNWNRISYNNNILWTTSMLKTFKNRINWNVFSYCSNKTVFTPENLEIYKDNWDWNCLSDSQEIEFSYEIIDKFVDKWNWKKLINNHHASACVPFNKQFLNYYNKYVPILFLHESCLWDCIIKQRTKELIPTIIRQQ